MKPEAALSKGVRELLKTLGFAVWSTEQGYRRDRGGTRCDPGIPDLIVMGRGMVFFVELKTGRNKLTIPQQVFQNTCEIEGGTSLVWRSVEDAWDWLVEQGIIEETVGGSVVRRVRGRQR